jgi:hypothetical protein
MGNPSLLNPHGIESAGKPVTLNGPVKRISEATGSPRSALGCGLCTSSRLAGAGAVGIARMPTD